MSEKENADYASVSENTSDENEDYMSEISDNDSEYILEKEYDSDDSRYESGEEVEDEDDLS